MGTSGGGQNGVVAEELLDLDQIDTGLDQVGGVTVAQALGRDVFFRPQAKTTWHRVFCTPPRSMGVVALAAHFKPSWRLGNTSGVVETSTEGMPGKYKDEFWFYGGNTPRQMNIEKEMGGGYTVTKSETPDRFTFMLWVSPNAKEQQPPYFPEKPNRCGPST